MINKPVCPKFQIEKAPRKQVRNVYKLFKLKRLFYTSQHNQYYVVTTQRQT